MNSHGSAKRLVGSLRARMRRTWVNVALLSIFVLGLPFAAWAAPTSGDQARSVVRAWLATDRRPLDTMLSASVYKVDTYKDSQGRALYYVVDLAPSGFVIVSADDLVEPIIAFAAEGHYDPSTKTPLGALVGRDLPARMAYARAQGQGQAPKTPLALGTQTAPKPLTKAQEKWSRFAHGGLFALNSVPALSSSLTTLSDIRVTPLLQSRWSQDVAYSQGKQVACYNYYTPTGKAGAISNYPCGCVATVMAQLMRFYQYPRVGVGAKSLPVTVNGRGKPLTLRGGNGSGGAYNWSAMPLKPGVGAALTAAQCQAVGALTYDAAVAVGMDFENNGSSAYFDDARDCMITVFKYSNAVYESIYNQAFSGKTFSARVNPNLDAGYPVMLGILKSGANVGHAVVCDGYGFNASTLYHHLNMGWAGVSDAWYSLPTIDAAYTFDTVDELVYNIYTSGSGEIISGRVLDSGGRPVSGVAVAATRSTGGSWSATTNSKGIYALAKLPAQSLYTISARKTGYTFKSQSAKTGLSGGTAGVAGNVWGINLSPPSTTPTPVPTPPPASPVSLGDALNYKSFTWVTEGNAKWYGQSATKHDGYYAARSGAIGASQSSTLRTQVTGPGTIGFWWGGSSEQDGDQLTFSVDGKAVEAISGARSWSPRRFLIAAGSHTLRWTYAKDATLSAGRDCGWVDQVTWNPAAAAGKGFTKLGLYKVFAGAVAVEGTYAYVMEAGTSNYHNRYLDILDVSKPASPVLKKKMTLKDDAWAIAVSQGFVYVTNDSNELQIIDARNPAAPKTVKSYFAAAAIADTALAGKMVYLAVPGAGVELVDVSSPALPRRRATYKHPTYHNVSQVTVAGATLYMADDSGMMLVVNASNPAAPVLRGLCGGVVAPMQIVASGTNLYVATYQKGFQIVNVASPAAPKTQGTVNIAQELDAVAVSGGLAYVTNYDAGQLQVFDVNSSTSPFLRASYAGLWMSDMALVGGLLYAIDDDGLLILRYQP